MFKTKTKSRLKRMLSGALALAMTASAAAVMPASAEETAKYPMLFLPLMKTQALLSIQTASP